MSRLSEQQVQIAMVSWFYAPAWYVRRMSSDAEENKYIKATMSDYYISLLSERVTSAEFEYAAACACKRLRKFPALADLLDYVQEYRQQAPPTLRIEHEGGASEGRDVHKKMSVRLLQVLQTVADTLPPIQQDKLYWWYHRATLSDVEQMLPKLLAGEQSVLKLTIRVENERG